MAFVAGGVLAYERIMDLEKELDSEIEKGLTNILDFFVEEFIEEGFGIGWEIKMRTEVS